MRVLTDATPSDGLDVYCQQRVLAGRRPQVSAGVDRCRQVGVRWHLPDVIRSARPGQAQSVRFLPCCSIGDGLDASAVPGGLSPPRKLGASACVGEAAGAEPGGAGGSPGRGLAVGVADPEGPGPRVRPSSSSLHAH